MTGTLEAVLGGSARYAALRGDNLEWLRQMPDASVDAVVTDPPYGLGKVPDMVEVLRSWLEVGDYKASGGGFMGRAWDAFVPGPSTWREVFRVLKPGGHVLAFAGTRTWDAMSLSLRLAGFELRDTLQWLYGSGFPKSLDVGKAIDKMAGAEREVVGSKMGLPGYSLADNGRTNQVYGDYHDPRAETTITAPATDAAKAWDGWGTALKPAWEPVLVFRKPLEAGSVAAQVLATGTGALHIDACRVATDERLAIGSGMLGYNSGADGHNSGTQHAAERWPSNLVLSHSPACVRGGRRLTRNADRTGYNVADEWWECAPDCPVAELDRQSGERPGASSNGRRGGVVNGYDGGWGQAAQVAGYGDAGGASRFFPTFAYVAKASRSEREAGLDHLPRKSAAEITGRAPGSAGLEGDGRGKNAYAGAHEGEPRANAHPTVKPIALMRWLVRLVTPAGGVVLDPWAGSFSTGVAVMEETELAARFIGFELDADGHDYVAVGVARMEHALREAAKPKKPARVPRKRAEKPATPPQAARTAPKTGEPAKPVSVSAPARRKRTSAKRAAEGLTCSLWGAPEMWEAPIETAVAS